ncbi:MAG TPA: hypothetical protein VFF73_25165 [Planctomycetota bacterium]|nr:hypothetical protein [Planctomycetota bacterium]
MRDIHGTYRSGEEFKAKKLVPVKLSAIELEWLDKQCEKGSRSEAGSTTYRWDHEKREHVHEPAKLSRSGFLRELLRDKMRAEEIAAAEQKKAKAAALTSGPQPCLSRRKGRRAST